MKRLFINHRAQMKRSTTRNVFQMTVFTEFDKNLISSC